MSNQSIFEFLNEWEDYAYRKNAYERYFITSKQSYFNIPYATEWPDTMPHYFNDAYKIIDKEGEYSDGFAERLLSNVYFIVHGYEKPHDDFKYETGLANNTEFDVYVGSRPGATATEVIGYSVSNGGHSIVVGAPEQKFNYWDFETVGDKKYIVISFKYYTTPTTAVAKKLKIDISNFLSSSGARHKEQAYDFAFPLSTNIKFDSITEHEIFTFDFALSGIRREYLLNNGEANSYEYYKPAGFMQEFRLLEDYQHGDGYIDGYRFYGGYLTFEIEFLGQVVQSNVVQYVSDNNGISLLESYAPGDFVGANSDNVYTLTLEKALSDNVELLQQFYEALNTNATTTLAEALKINVYATVYRDRYQSSSINLDDLVKMGSATLTSDAKPPYENGEYSIVSYPKYNTSTSLSPSPIYTYSASIRISDSSPTISPEIKDVNPVALSLTGDENTLIRYISDAQVKPNVAPRKEATIIRQWFYNDGIGYENYESIVLENITSDKFTFYATDNRNETTRLDYTVENFIKYIPLTCNFRSSNPTGDGEVSIELFGNYFDGSFGAQDNELFVYYRLKPLDGVSDYSDWIAVPATIDHETNTYVANMVVEGLQYRYTYLFQGMAADIYSSIHSTEKSVSATPLFDWSATDFNFNVPVKFNNGRTFGGDNALLWAGNAIMYSNDIIELSQPIEEQVSGIVLVFSATDDDVSWNTFFVPKNMTTYNSGGGQTFMMANNAGLSTFAAKYLYISDTTIEGHPTNGDSGTAASGIKFNNAAFQLRYVFGV